MQKPLVNSIFGVNVILIIIFISNIWSSHAQNVNQQHDPDYLLNGGSGGGGGSGGVDNSAEGGTVNSGEISRLPILNENEPSCEELKAMWRYVLKSCCLYINIGIY